MAIHFFGKIQSYKKKKTYQSNFSIECGIQLAYEAAQKSLDEKLHFFSIQAYSSQYECHKIAALMLLD
jgi:hypothetical protein